MNKYTMNTAQKVHDLLNRLNQKKPDHNFPVEIFPKKIQNIISNLRDGLNFSEEYLGSALIHAAGTAIGNSTIAKYNHEDSCIMYMVVIGNPGDNKTQPIAWAYAPIKKRDEDSLLEYLKAIEEYNESLSESKRNRHTLAIPQLKQVITNDVTVQGVSKHLLSNKRSICVIADELAGFFNSFQKNQQQWLSLWSKQNCTITRKSSPTIIIRKPFVSIIGTMQSKILASEMMKGDKNKNGFLDRFLIVDPEQVPPPIVKKAANLKEAESEWVSILKPLMNLELKLDETGTPLPNILEFTPAAQEYLQEYLNKPESECEFAISDEVIKQITAKLQIYFFRLCIPIQLLRWSCEEAVDNVIEIQTVERAALLIEYFKRNAFKAWTEINQTNPLDNLGDEKERLYEKLPDTFRFDRGLSIALAYMSKRNFQYWLNDKKLFKRLSHGLYEKVYS